MRKTIFLILAVFVGFGVFAQNPQHASAPTESIAIAVKKLSGQAAQGRAALSAIPVSVPRPVVPEAPAEEPKILPADSAILNENAASLHSVDAEPVRLTVGDSALPVPQETPTVPTTTAASAAPAPGTASAPAAPANKPAQTAKDFCDDDYVGEPLTFTQTMDLKLNDLMNQIHRRYGINFLMGGNIGDSSINIKTAGIPWNVLLKSQLFLNGIRAKCLNGNTIELVKNEELSRLRDTAEVETRFVKLKFLQRTTNSSVGLSGQSQGGQGGCGSSGGGLSGGSGGGGGGSGGSQNGETAAQQGSTKFDKLIVEVEKVLGIRSMRESIASGDRGGSQGSNTVNAEEMRTDRFVTQIPGRNILMIRATEYEHDLINQIIERADRPPFQVIIKGLVYTANQDRLRDIGLQTDLFGASGPDSRHTGSIIGNTLGTGALFDFSSIIGTFDFNVQAKALQQNGVLSVKSRPFATVVDGLCTQLNVGRALLIPIDGGFGEQGGVEELRATNLLAVAPYVIDDENGNPVAVTLDLTLTANDIDNSVSTRGVPAISERSISTQLLLAEDKTAILGGFTVDEDSRSVSKTPGLGDIPIIGELFKRRIRDTRVNRLYFAISVSVIPYGEAIRPVDVPGATTDPPSITPTMLERSLKAEPESVNDPGMITKGKSKEKTQKAEAAKTGP